MSPALQKMWISFGAMLFMMISLLSIYFSRFKLKNKILRILTAIVAYTLMIFAGIIIFVVVASGPTK
ncbi:DUF2768 domain-containing protein [Bacillus sp. AGMB 02131]|uniref:DUF2768 domain-containing protein n=1 Tax=Peribacillus faecalis TaxID=2772559 RepID=A0A927CZ60_9BACI|nr:DUF2768 domain-containing protein [Peribacillus faecalis]MBD3110383.1 DUF2768 domain-containing protein [Peribacillus faecalis]